MCNDLEFYPVIVSPADKELAEHIEWIQEYWQQVLNSFLLTKDTMHDKTNNNRG